MCRQGITNDELRVLMHRAKPRLYRESHSLVTGVEAIKPDALFTVPRQALFTTKLR